MFLHKLGKRTFTGAHFMRRCFLSLALTLLAAGCSGVVTTNDKSTDPQAVQHYLPNIATYNATNAKSVTDALTGLGGTASLLANNAALSALLAKLDSLLTCYQNVGAVTASIYTPQAIDPTSADIPNIGVVALVNQDRLRRDFLACLTGGGNPNFSAQAATVQPCVGSGNFTVQGETISYIYAATRPDLCALFEQHFTNIKNTVK
jgi:uncharacterized protein YceK